MSVFMSLNYSNLLLVKHLLGGQGARNDGRVRLHGEAEVTSARNAQANPMDRRDTTVIDTIEIDRYNDVYKRVFQQTNVITRGKINNKSDYAPDRDYKSVFVMCLRLRDDFVENLSGTARLFTVHTSSDNDVLITRCDVSDSFADKDVCPVYEHMALERLSIGEFDNEWLFSLDRITFEPRRKRDMFNYTLCGRGTWWRYDRGIILLGVFAGSWCFVYYELHPRYTHKRVSVYDSLFNSRDSSSSSGGISLNNNGVGGSGVVSGNSIPGGSRLTPRIDASLVETTNASNLDFVERLERNDEQLLRDSYDALAASTDATTNRLREQQSLLFPSLATANTTSAPMMSGSGVSANADFNLFYAFNSGSGGGGNGNNSGESQRRQSQLLATGVSSSGQGGRTAPTNKASSSQYWRQALLNSGGGGSSSNSNNNALDVGALSLSSPLLLGPSAVVGGSIPYGPGNNNILSALDRTFRLVKVPAHDYTIDECVPNTDWLKNTSESINSQKYHYFI